MAVNQIAQDDAACSERLLPQQSKPVVRGSGALGERFARGLQAAGMFIDGEECETWREKIKDQRIKDCMQCALSDYEGVNIEFKPECFGFYGGYGL